MGLPISHPHPVIENPVVLRAAGVLELLSAFDPAPVEIAVGGFRNLMLYVTYTRGGAGGSVRLRIESSPTPAASWYQAALYEADVLAAGTDAVSLIQREFVQYAAVGAGAESFFYGPIAFEGTIERIRVAGAEIGAPLTPGTLAIVGVLSE